MNEMTILLLVIIAGLVVFGVIAYMQYLGVIKKESADEVEKAEQIIALVAKIACRYDTGFSKEIKMVNRVTQLTLQYVKGILDADGDMVEKAYVVDYAINLANEFNADLTEEDVLLISDIVDTIYIVLG